jgi:uncharacterized membrane protein YobD (UPF0266 family)
VINGIVVLMMRLPRGQRDSFKVGHLLGLLVLMEIFVLIVRLPRCILKFRYP